MPVGPHLLAGVVLSVVLLLYFGPTALRGQSLAEGEGVTYYLPLREMVASAWKRGHWPAWNPYVYGGMPLLADCQAGVFYPPNLLYLLLPPVAAMNVILLAERILSAWGMVLLLRSQRASGPAALAGAGVFVFSGFMIAHLGHVSIINAAAWIPWICLAVCRWCTGGGRGWLVAGTLLWAVQFLAGHPQIVVYTAILVVMVLVLLAVHRRLHLKRGLAGLAVMAALAMALCAAQILPTLAMSAETGRSLTPSYELFGRYHLLLIHTPMLWVPFLFGTQDHTPLGWDWWGAWNFVEQAGYVGLLPWMLLPAAAWLPAARARMGRGWAVIAGLHLVLAWNIDTPIGRLLFHVPLYNAFEAAGRHLVGMNLALAVTTALALDALPAAEPAAARRLARRGAGAVIALVVTLVAGGMLGYEYAIVHLRLGLRMMPRHLPFEQHPWPQAPWAFAAPVVIAALSAWVLCRFAARPGRWRLMTVMLVLLADVASAGYLGAWRWRHESTLRPRPPEPDLAAMLSGPADASAPPPRYVLFGDWGPEYAIHPQGNMLYRLASLNGYGPFQFRRFHRMVGQMNHNGTLREPAVLHPSPALDLWACRYAIAHERDVKRPPATSPADDAPALLSGLPGYRRVASRGGRHVFENTDALPHAWLADEVLPLPGP
ncbi:MAG: hypothetical protein HRF43_17455, partial [Phycisphaerae bacterium]